MTTASSVLRCNVSDKVVTWVSNITDARFLKNSRKKNTQTRCFCPNSSS